MLADFERIGEVSWGLYAYSYLIDSMRVAVRGDSNRRMVHGVLGI